MNGISRFNYSHNARTTLCSKVDTDMNKILKKSDRKKRMTTLNIITLSRQAVSQLAMEVGLKRRQISWDRKVGVGVCIRSAESPG